MNVAKVQTDLLTSWVKAEEKGEAVRKCFIIDKKKDVVFITDGYAGYFIPQHLLFLDTKKMRELSQFPIELPGNSDEYRLEWRGTEKIINYNQKVKVLEGSSWETYVDPKYLRNFDLKATTFYQAKPKGIVVAYEKQNDKDVLVGIVCPIYQINTNKNNL